MTPALTRSEQDYLKALYALAPGGEPVATSSLAGRLSLSAPSVTNMLGKLAAARLVAHTPRAGARLTARGRMRALEKVRRHRILETFLVRVLKLDWAEVHADAEVLEHHISDRVLDAIDRLVGHPHEDPHGHPIPDRKGRVRHRALVPLSQLGRGVVAVVRELREADRPRLEHWIKRAGLEPEIRRRTGLVLDPYFSGTKLEWMLGHDAGLAARARRGEVAFGTVDSWLVWNLTGGEVHATDPSNASRTMLFDIDALDWCDDLLEGFDIPAAVLPQVRPSSADYDITRGLGFLPDGIPVTGVAGDQQPALFGQGCVRPGQSKNTYGTGCFLLLNTGRKPVASRSGRHLHRHPGRLDRDDPD